MLTENTADRRAGKIHGITVQSLPVLKTYTLAKVQTNRAVKSKGAISREAITSLKWDNIIQNKH